MHDLLFFTHLKKGSSFKKNGYFYCCIHKIPNTICMITSVTHTVVGIKSNVHDDDDDDDDDVFNTLAMSISYKNRYICCERHKSYHSF